MVTVAPAASATVAPAAEGCCTPALAGPPLADDAAVELSTVYAALADPVRLRLLSLIATAGEMCSCDLIAPLGKSQPTVSHHTKVLAEAGLLEGDKRGRWVHWRVPDARRGFVEQVLGG